MVYDYKTEESNMAFVKVTDGAVTRFYDLNNPRSKAVYKELMNHNTGYNCVVLPDGTTKEFTEEQVKEQINKTRIATGKTARKEIVDSNRGVQDEE